MSIKEQIQQYMAENFLFSENGFDLGDDVSFLDEGIVDSTGTLELVMFVEETFNIEVEDDEIEPENFDSINNLMAYIKRKHQDAPGQ
jgi:acyl carrier protein